MCDSIVKQCRLILSKCNFDKLNLVCVLLERHKNTSEWKKLMTLCFKKLDLLGEKYALLFLTS
jgi:hypothetical protein